MNFEFVLAEEKVKPHQVTTLHLVTALAFIVAGAIIAVYNYTIPGWGVALAAAGLLTLALTIFRNRWVVRRRINLILRIKELAISLVVCSYSLIQQWKFPSLIFGMLSAAILFALYWERSAGNSLQVHIDDSGIRMPVFRRRFIPWTEIENIVLRFGTLTINCTDNHCFQWSLAETGVDSTSFEQYCDKMVDEHISRRPKDDW